MVDIRVGVGGGDKGDFELGWRQVDSLVQHPAEEASVHREIALLRAGKIADGAWAEEEGKHASQLLAMRGDPVLFRQPIYPRR